MVFLTGCVPHSTGSTEVGVRTVKFALFGQKGVEERVYAPGSTYFFLPFINDWHTFDTKLQNLEMTYDRGRGDRKSRDDLLFKTIDGNDISLDVIIAYRIDPKKAHLIVQYVADSDRLLRDKLVRTIARSKPRDIFGELKTEEYKRKLEEAKGEVNKMVANADGEYRRAKIEADVHFEKQELIAEAIKTEGIATARGIRELNNAMAGSGGEALVKLRIAEAIQGKKIVLLPVSEGGMNLKTTDINRLIDTMGIKALSKKQ